jgi:ribosomal-protein-alanine N-acetyltransferase
MGAPASPAAAVAVSLAEVRVVEAQPSNWRDGLPVLAGSQVTLRELRSEDAPALLMMVADAEVSRFISPPPATLDGFERFIAWTVRERQCGRHACFAVVPHGSETAVGLLQVRQLDSTFSTAEWGFAIGAAFWGKGLFVEASHLVLQFAFETLGVSRLEARACTENVRGNGALRKIGAVPEGVLRQSFRKNGHCYDQVLWSILQEDWLQAKAVWGGRARVH